MPYRQVSLKEFLAALSAAGPKKTKRDLKAAGLRTVKWFVHQPPLPAVHVGMTMVLWNDDDVAETIYFLWEEHPVFSD